MPRIETKHGLCVIVELADAEVARALAALPIDERWIVNALTPHRRREYVAGRTALHLALSELGHRDPTPITADDRGAPRLPAGYVGSISHKGPVAAGLVAHDAGARIGVDLELAAPSRTDIGARVLTPAELARCPDRGRAVTLRFAIKEAIYKAVDPFVRRYVGFHEVELDVADDGTCSVASALPLAITASWREHAGHWIATAEARFGAEKPAR